MSYPERENMKSLLQLWQLLATEAASLCRTSADRDIETVAIRVEQEGESFFTITLPNFGKEFERALEVGKLEASSFPGWKTRKGSPLPRFLGGLTSLVFDTETGVLHDEPDVTAIDAVRQLSLVFGKVERPCTPERENSAFAQFIMTDRMVKDWQVAQLWVPKGHTLDLQLPDLTIMGECHQSVCFTTTPYLGPSPASPDWAAMHWHVRTPLRQPHGNGNVPLNS